MASPVIQLIADHWAALGTQSLVVPELNDLEIHWRPTTAADLAGVNAKYDSPVDRATALIQLKALDANGDRLFTDGIGDFKTLRHQLPWHLVDQISAAMMPNTGDAVRLGEPSAENRKPAES